MTVAAASGAISWKVAATQGKVVSVGLTVNGKAVSAVSGSGAAYTANFGTLAPGTYAYVITAADSRGYTSKTNGSFTVAATCLGDISGVGFSFTKGSLNWNVVDSAAAITGVQLVIDGLASKSNSAIQGPTAAASVAAQYRAPSAADGLAAATPTSLPLPTSSANRRRAAARLPSPFRRSA